MVASLLLVCLSVSQEDWAQDPSCLGEGADSYRRVAALSEEISLLNLINGLQLTQPQMRQLADLARRAATARREELERRRAAVEKLQTALKDLRTTLLERDAVIPT